MTQIVGSASQKEKEREREKSVDRELLSSNSDAFFGNEMRGPAGTGRGGVSMAGGREGQLEGARKGNRVRGHRLPQL